MRQAHFAAIAALHQVAWFECVMGTAAIAAAFADFTFRLRGHGLAPVVSSMQLTDFTAGAY
jgi:hypothetical protein